MADFGSWLLGEIDRKKMNQTDFADAIGRSKQIVSEWISNDAIPGDESIDLIARELGIESLEVYRILRGIRPRDPMLDAEAQEAADLVRLTLPPYREAGLAVLRTLYKESLRDQETDEGGEGRET